MKERPILFSTPMILALLADRKTVTRRIVTHRRPITFLGGQGEQDDPSCWGYFFDGPNQHGYAVLARGLNERHDHGRISIPSPYGEPGDRLYVKEAAWLWCRREEHGKTETGRPKLLFVPVGKYVSYAATDSRPTDRVDDDPACGWRLKIGRFLPRWASRITLDVLDVRVERLHDITEEDARAEGVRPFFETLPGISRDQCLTTGERAADAEHRAGFALLWDELNGDRANWKSNPWVWRVQFRRVDSASARRAR